MRRPPAPTDRTWMRMSCRITHWGHPHLDEPAAGNLPAIVAADQLVVVEAGGVHTGVGVAHHDQRVDVGPRLGFVTVDRDHLIGQPVHGVSGHRMRLLHELRDRVGALPGTDLAVVQLAIVGEDRAKQGPVPAIDPSRITHQDISDILTIFSLAHFTSPFGCTMIRAGPVDFRAEARASGTSSRPTTAPTLGSGSSRPAAIASSVPYQSCGCGPPPNWMVTP